MFLIDSGVIGRKEDFTSIDKRTVHHYSSLAVDIAETVIRALARIVFIEDSMTSLKVRRALFIYGTSLTMWHVL